MNKCPSCKIGTLAVITSIELGPDANSDNFRFETFSCGHCDFGGAGEYEESQRGGDASFAHRGYAMARADFTALDTELRLCAARKNHRCTCPVHMRYRATTGVHSPTAKLALVSRDPIALG